MSLYPQVVTIQSAKILLLPPKYEIIMLPFKYSFFQYCDSNIRLFSIAPCKVITLNPFKILFDISALLLFDGSISLSVYHCDSDSCRSFSLLKAIAKRLPLLFAKAIAIVGRAITIWEAIQKRSHKPIYKTNTKI